MLFSQKYCHKRIALPVYSFLFQMFELKEVKGDLFSCPSTTSLAHCISADCHMGKGIAVIFKKKFGGVKELLSQGLLKPTAEYFKHVQSSLFSSTYSYKSITAAWKLYVAPLHGSMVNKRVTN